MKSHPTGPADIEKALGRVGISQPLTELLSAEQIKEVLPKFYRIMAAMLHPDLQVGASPGQQEEAIERFKLLEQAYSDVSASANNPNSWETLMGALGASEMSAPESRATSEALETERAVRATLSRQVTELTNANQAMTATLHAVVADVQRREAVRTENTGEISSINILASGSCVFRVSEDAYGEDMDLELGVKPKISTLVTLKTDERKNIVSLKLNKGRKQDYSHLTGATILGAIDREAYTMLGRGPYSGGAARDAVRLTSSKSSVVQPKEIWEISREKFSSVVLPNLRLTVSREMALVLVKNDGLGASKYYVSFLVGTDSPTQKKLASIEHNPLP